MDYRRAGNSGLQLSALSIGGWLTFGGTIHDDTTGAILKTAIDAGVNFVDLADVYAQGGAERAAAKFLKDYKRSDLVISSKVFWPMSDNVNDKGLSRKHIMESIDRTLATLKTDYLDLYFCHREDPATPLDETVRAMDDLVRRGKILYWGTSVWQEKTLTKAHEIAAQKTLYPPQVEQPEYNLLSRSIERGIFATTTRFGMGIVVWSPLAGGLLTGKYNDGIPPGSRATTSRWLEGKLNPGNIDRLRQFSAIARELGVEPSQLALAWILLHPEISSVITGATKPEHVTSNLKALDVKIDSSVRKQIESIFPR